MSDADDGAVARSRRPAVLWFTGYSGAGKTTIAHALERRLREAGLRVNVLDGDVVRQGLCSDLTFSDSDRAENIRRVTEVAKLMFEAGAIVIVALISPLRVHRDAARKSFGAGDFFEVFIDTPLSVAEARDPKGLYQRARAHLVQDFTGVDALYEPPTDPDVHITTVDTSPDAASTLIVGRVQRLQTYPTRST